MGQWSMWREIGTGKGRERQLRSGEHIGTFNFIRFHYQIMIILWSFFAHSLIILWFFDQIGDRVSVGHLVMLHGCTILDDVLIGMKAIVMDSENYLWEVKSSIFYIFPFLNFVNRGHRTIQYNNRSWVFGPSRKEIGARISVRWITRQARQRIEGWGVGVDQVSRSDIWVEWCNELCTYEN